MIQGMASYFQTSVYEIGWSVLLVPLLVQVMNIADQKSDGDIDNTHPLESTDGLSKDSGMVTRSNSQRKLWSLPRLTETLPVSVS